MRTSTNRTQKTSCGRHQHVLLDLLGRFKALTEGRQDLGLTDASGCLEPKLKSQLFKAFGDGLLGQDPFEILNFLEALNYRTALAVLRCVKHDTQDSRHLIDLIDLDCTGSFVQDFCIHTVVRR